MDFSDALSSRVSGVNPSRDFRGHLEQNDAPVVSPARAQTHYRSCLRFLSSGLEKAVKQKVIFFLHQLRLDGVAVLKVVPGLHLTGQFAMSRRISSDLFAFGALLYEMLTGHKAFSGESQASLVTAK